VSRKKFYWLAAIAVAVVFVVSVNSSYQAGDRAGRAQLERLQLVWPGFLDLPEADRAVIAGFALSCHLEGRAAVPGEVASCLREAAADPAALKPKDMTQDAAASALARLLASRGYL